MEQFKNFDSYKHKQHHVTIDSSLFEIWHSRNATNEDIALIAKRYVDHELAMGRELASLYRLDMRPY